MLKTTDSVLGVPVYFDSGYQGLSETRGFFSKRIVVGLALTRLTPRERQAVLLHEAAHAKLRHPEKRILPMLWACLTHPVLLWHVLMATDLQLAVVRWTAFLADSGMAEFAQAQEYQADRFAKDCGYGDDLAQVFLRFGSGGVLHPSLQSRLTRLAGA